MIWNGLSLSRRWPTSIPALQLALFHLFHHPGSAQSSSWQLGILKNISYTFPMHNMASGNISSSKPLTDNNSNVIEAWKVWKEPRVHGGKMTEKRWSTEPHFMVSNRDYIRCSADQKIHTIFFRSVLFALTKEFASPYKLSCLLYIAPFLLFQLQSLSVILFLHLSCFTHSVSSFH